MFVRCGREMNWRKDSHTCWTCNLSASHTVCAGEKFQVSSMGFEPMTSAMPVQGSHQLSYEATQMWAGQFAGIICSYERNYFNFCFTQGILAMLHVTEISCFNDLIFLFCTAIIATGAHCHKLIFMWLLYSTAQRYIDSILETRFLRCKGWDIWVSRCKNRGFEKWEALEYAWN